MKRDELVKYWRETAEHDFITMENLFASGDYVWCLFVGHLVIEKLLKACYVKYVDINYPRIHDLTRIADRIGFKMTSEQREKLDDITGFNIEARYPSEKYNFYKKATQAFTVKALENIKEIRQWLLEKL